MKKKYKVILHVDLNAFFASCEMAKDPSLRKVPLGIGGKSDRGVLTTANYIAREYGVTSAMSVVEAKKRCPNLVILPGNFDLYRHYSKLFFEVLTSYGCPVEKGSIDEGYIDLTELTPKRHPLDIAKEIQNTLNSKHHLPVSIGVAPNMFLAKMASDMKKPLGITVLRKRDVKEKLWPLPIDDMYGIGKKTAPDLKHLGIQTIGDLVHFKDKRKLSIVLGNQMDHFIDKAKGNSNKDVTPNRYIDMKSIGNSQTYTADIHDYQEALNKLKKLTRKVIDRLVEDRSVAKTLSLQVRYNDFSQINRSQTLEYHTDNFLEVFETIETLFYDNQKDKPIRLLGVSVSNLKDKSDHFKQIDLFNIPKNAKQDERVNSTIDSINKAYGETLIKKGFIHSKQED
ncbi:MAG: DNA polymerase IV [Candidatus Izimaplasma sp.]|nr:DNA polymerase IV [Candidatus Izimaplasma bacterium]